MGETQGHSYDWNGATGETWVENQALLDAMFEGVGNRLVETLPEDADEAILDIGCGTGATSLAIAERLGKGAQVTGLDISEPMIACARKRAENVPHVDFIAADAGAHDFGGARFDRLVSRFGVMFFEDPTATFAHLRHATKPGGTMHFLTWREPKANAFMIASGRAAREFFPDMPGYDPDAPGQFGLAEPARIEAIFAGTGWQDVRWTPHEIPCSFPRADLDTFIRRVGPVARLMGDSEEAERERIVDAIRPAFDPFIEGDKVRVTAGCWMIEGRNAA